MKNDREDIILKLVGVLPVLLVIFLQLNLAARAEVIEYLKKHLLKKKRLQRLGCPVENKYELMEFDIDARFYK